MKKKEEFLDAFISKMGYLTDERIIGIVKYKGYIPGYSYEQSDIGLCIITNDENMFVIKNNVIFDDLKIEYYERSLSDIYILTDISSTNFISSIAALVGIGKIILDKNGEIKSLQDYVIQKYSTFFSKEVDDNLIDMEKMIVISLGSLQSMLNCNSPFFSYNYYLLLDQIKQLYIKIHDLDDFTTLDAFVSSSNNQFNQGKYDDFFTMYIDSIVCEGSNLEKFDMLSKLYNYVSLSKERSNSYLLIKELCNNI